jgi:hypothetical protein
MAKFSFSSSSSLKLYNNSLSFFFTTPQRSFSSQNIVNSGGVYTDLNHKLITTDSTNEKKVVSYKEICDIENLELGLKRTKSGMSAGLDGEIKANYTIGKLEKLAEELKSHRYKASPIKKV